MNYFLFVLGTLASCALVGGVSIGAPPSSAEKTSDPPECHWTDEPILVDGRAEESSWKNADVMGRFSVPWLGNQPHPADSATRARLLWDREFLYFFAELEDTDLMESETEHDGMAWLSDVFELFLKPDDAKPGYYEFQVNVANSRLDMYVPQREKFAYYRFRKKVPFRFESAVQTQGTINLHQDTDQGWSVEGRIAWRDFIQTGGRPIANEIWRFAICRYDYTSGRDPELSTNAPLSKPDFHYYEDYARLRFVGRRPSSTDIPAHVPWTTSRVKGSADPPKPFHLVRAYPQLNVDYPLCLRPIPGTDQFLLINLLRPFDPARLLRVHDDPHVDSFDVLVNYEESEGVAYSIDFHPEFSQNGYVFVGLNQKNNDGIRMSRVVRYQMSTEPPYEFDSESATVIIEWPSDGHNGGGVAFGPDGMLYLTSGDGTSDSDTDLTGQRMDGLHAKLLRIDVDHPADGLRYGVPSDNPYVGLTQARPETWAYGFRNPWRLCIDQHNGNIWVANNGQDLWEQVYLVQRGANYGWSAYEGSHPFYPDRERGPAVVSLPAFEHHHAEARSMTGGVVYYGDAFPDLQGAYVYGDHETGRIWAGQHDGTAIKSHHEIADTLARISEITLDRNGEILVCDLRTVEEGGGIFRLQRNVAQDDSKDFPRRLSDAGLFADLPEHQVQPGVISYSVNVPAWHDGAWTKRFLGLPASKKEDGTLDVPTIGFHPQNSWALPEGTVVAQSLGLAVDAGNPDSVRWIETRLLTQQNGQWGAYTYLWNERQTDANLVDAGGTTFQLAVREQGKFVQRMWHVPSRAECLSCHSRQAAFVLGICTPQLNRDHNYGPFAANQLDAFEHWSLMRVDWLSEANEAWMNDLRPEYPDPRTAQDAREINGAIERRLSDQWDDDDEQRESPESNRFYQSSAKYDRLVPMSDVQAGLTERARAYLHVNCASCHVTSGGGNSQMDLRHSISAAMMNVIDVDPLHATFGLKPPRLVAGGDPSRSVLNFRMTTLVGGRMPRIGSHVVDVEGVRLIREWIASLNPPAGHQDQALQHADALYGADIEMARQAADELLETTSGALTVIGAMDAKQLTPDIAGYILRIGTTHPDTTIQHLFERFVPEHLRVERLGTMIDPKSILDIKGDIARGRKLVLQSNSLACLSCHQLDGRGHAVGPDLVHRNKNKQKTRAELLESMLDPSRDIDDKFATRVVFTNDGRFFSGLLVEQNDVEIVIRQPGGKLEHINANEVDEVQRQSKSLMPDDLLQDLTAQQAADLLEYLYFVQFK